MKKSPQVSAKKSGSATPKEPVKFKTLKTDQLLFAEGETGESIFIVNSGKLGVFRWDLVTRKKVKLSEVGEHQIVGEMALLDKGARSASVQALEPSEVLELATSELEEYLAKQPVWLKVLFQSLASRLRATNQKIHSST